MDILRKTLLTSAIALSIGANAGTMGPVEVQRSIVPFGSLEGSYTWNKIGKSTIDGVVASMSKNGWGGRAAAGLKHNYNEKVSLSGEIGWGYYGNATETTSSLASGRFTITGIDLLVGPIYHYNYKLDIFAKAGVMLENLRVNALVNVGQITGIVQGIDRRTESYSDALPELKTGFAFHFTEQMDISLAYMYVSGYNPKYNKNYTISGGRLNDNGHVVRNAATLNSIMLGLTYNFV